MDGLKLKAKVRAAAVAVDAERWEGEPKVVETLQGPITITEGDWLVVVPYGSRMVFKHDDFTSIFEVAEGRVSLEMNGYQATNLREALRAVLGENSGALSSLNTGDWCGELVNALEEVDIPEEPNATAEEMKESARSWK